ncbi:trissin receptor-like [Littorina saxatilis]|uniref:trissin receptor-like n=1 Tax=Littorina saxatilis TaxID=31220 RepID=UPI0038B5793C
MASSPKGNSLVLTVMTRSPALRTRNNLFLCHLAVADLSVGLVCIIPNLIVARVMVWMPRTMGVFLCKFYNFFEEFSMTVSVLLLVLIAAERYVAIIHPLKARRLFTRFRMHAALGSDKRSRSSCTSRTSCSTTVSTSNTAVIDNDLANDSYHHRHDNGTCRPLLRACRSDPSRHDDHLGHDLFVHKRRNTVTTDHLPMTFTIPSSSTSSTSSRRQRFSTGSEMSSDTCRSVFYMPTLPSADSSAPLLASSSPEPPGLAGGQASAPVANSSASAVPLTTSGSRDGVYILRPGTNTKTASCRYRVTSHHVLMTRRKVVRLLIVVLSSFALCVLPFHIRSLLWYWMPGQSQWKYGLPKYITQVLFFLNSALNPVLYSLMSDSFRRSARQVLCCNCRTRRPNKNLAAFGAREARNHHLALSRQAAQRIGINRQ